MKKSEFVYANVMDDSWYEENIRTCVALREITMSVTENGDTWICLSRKGARHIHVSPQAGTVFISDQV